MTSGPMQPSPIWQPNRTNRFFSFWYFERVRKALNTLYGICWKLRPACDLGKMNF